MEVEIEVEILGLVRSDSEGYSTLVVTVWSYCKGLGGNPLHDKEGNSNHPEQGKRTRVYLLCGACITDNR